MNNIKELLKRFLSFKIMLMGSLQSSQVSDTKEFFIVDNLQYKLLRIIFCTARVVSRVELGKTRIYRHIAECPQEYLDEYLESKISE